MDFTDEGRDVATTLQLLALRSGGQLWIDQ